LGGFRVDSGVGSFAPVGVALPSHAAYFLLTLTHVLSSSALLVVRRLWVSNLGTPTGFSPPGVACFCVLLAGLGTVTVAWLVGKDAGEPLVRKTLDLE
jgi:hypothetical protein